MHGNSHVLDGRWQNGDVHGTDDDGGSGYATVQFVVYGPNGGFVTGGGWINVVGSYTADPTLSGRANFGFNSQYKKGATVPTGATEFRFQVGNFDYHSRREAALAVAFDSGDELVVDPTVIRLLAVSDAA